MPRLSAIYIGVCLLAAAHVSPASASESFAGAKDSSRQDHAVDQVSAAGRHGGPSTSRACLPYELKNALATIESRFGPVKVVSTHRPGARIAGTRHASYHASCRAVDFHPAPGKYREVLAYLRSNWNGGIGTYSGQQHHLHIDVGPKIAWHTHVGGSRVAAGDRPAPRRAVAQRYRATNGYQTQQSIY
jgi:hypothetical protein